MGPRDVLRTGNPLPLWALCAAALVLTSARTAAAIPTNVTHAEPSQTSYLNPVSPITVYASNILVPGSRRCRWTRMGTGEVTETSSQGTVTSTSMPCQMLNRLTGCRGVCPAGPYFVRLSDNGGAQYSTTGATVLLECDPGQFGLICSTCYCNPSPTGTPGEYCNSGYQGDGYCHSCPTARCDSTCQNWCFSCNFHACVMDTCGSPCVCNPGYYSANCGLQCPGGAATPCSGNGVCDDGASGTGACSCTDGQFWGAACENACSPNCLDSQCRQSDGACLACPAPGLDGDCSPICQVGAPDADGDGYCDLVDTCPSWATADLTDSDGNGRGDACECGDQNGDGTVDVRDLIAINLAIFNPTTVTPLCDANGDGLCNVGDIVAANAEIFSPGNTSTCARQPAPGP